MHRFLAALTLGLTLAACGDDDEAGSAQAAALTATGSIPVTATDFASVSRTATCEILAEAQTVGLAVVAIGASDRPGLCAAATAGQERQGARTITVVLAATNPLGAATLAPGAYPINPAGIPAQAAFVTVTQSGAVGAPGAGCAIASEVEATGGTVTLSSSTGGRFQGTVQATLSDGGAVTGAFDAPGCAVAIAGDLCAGEVIPPATSCVP
jgi:hypothetical protein